MQAKPERFNPFISKTPVRGKSFFGRDDLLRKLCDYINAGESVSLVGERRTGKTSILVRVLDWKEQFLSQPIQHVLVLVDFLGLDYRSDMDIWITLMTALLNEMAKAGLETEGLIRAVEQLQSGKLIFQTLLKMFRTLANDGVGVTFLFDEFEATAYGDNPVDLSFYKILRNLALDKGTRVSYVIATRQGLSKVERSLEKQFTALSSPLFNIFHQLIVTPFSEIEARQMVNGLLQSAGLDMAAQLGFGLQRDLLFQLSSFHPFFLQMACYQLFEHCVLPDRAFSDQVPEDEIVSAFMSDASPHFGYYWEASSAEEKCLMRQLATDSASVDIQSQRSTLVSLRNRCLVVEDAQPESKWRLFSSAFAEWIRERTSAKVRRAMEDCQWSEAAALLEELLRFDPTNGEVQQQLVRARVNARLDALGEEAGHHEASGDSSALVRVLDEMLALEPGNRRALERKAWALQQVHLERLYRQALSSMELGELSRAKHLLDEIDSNDAEYKDIRERRKQVALNQAIGIMRRWGFPLAVIWGAGLLILLLPGLTVETRQRLGLAETMGTLEFVGSAMSVFALIVGIMGSSIRTDRMYELLSKDSRLRACLFLAVLLATAYLLTLLVVALVPRLDPSSLCNGSFEDGFNCWENAGNLNQTTRCEAGNCVAILGDPNYPCEGGVPVGQASIIQSFTVPQTVSPTLSLRYRVFSYDLDLDQYDFFGVSVNGKPVGQFGNTDWDMASCQREVWDSSWQSVEFDLSTYRGERVELSLYSVNGADEWWNTWTYVDDVELR